MRQLTSDELNHVSGGLRHIEFCTGATSALFGVAGAVLGSGAGLGFGAGVGFSAGLSVGSAVGMMACSHFFRD